MRFMLVLAVVLAALASVASVQEAVYISAFQTNVYFDVPDTTRWSVERDELDTTIQKRFLMFTHTPIKDKKGRMVSPVIAIIIEPVPDPSDLVMYSVAKRSAVPYKVTKVFTSETHTFSYKNSVGYEATYTSEGVPHSIYVGHMIYKNLGIEIICDSTKELLPKVKEDFLAFLRSVVFNETED